MNKLVIIERWNEYSFIRYPGGYRMKVLCLDYETSISNTIHGALSKDPNNDFYTIIFGDKPDNIIIMHNKDGFCRNMPKEFWTMLDNTNILIGHNFKFDLSYIWHDKRLHDWILNGGKVWDLGLAEYLLTAQQHCFASLAELQQKYLGHKTKIDRISKLYKRNIGADKILAAKRRCRRLYGLYEQYCCQDGSSTLEIFKKQYLLAKSRSMLPIIGLYMDYLLAVTNMECTGVYIDVDACEKLMQEFRIKEVKYTKIAQKCLESVWTNERLPEFNPSSVVHKSAALFGGIIKTNIKTLIGKYKNGNDKYSMVEHEIYISGFGIDKNLAISTKKDGVYKIDDKIRDKIIEKYANNKLLVSYCNASKEASMCKKMASTYCKNFLDLQINGKIHPNFNLTTTKTGRLSSNAPNFQNIPSKNKYGDALHSLLIAPPDWICCEIDFSMLEIFIEAWLSGDKSLEYDLLNGIDLHCKRLSYYNTDKTYEEIVDLCKKQHIPEWELARSKAKTVSYQAAYGATSKKIAESTGLDEEIVKTIFEQEALAYPKTKEFNDEVFESIRRNVKYSKGCNISSKQTLGINGFKIVNGLELCPIFDKYGNVRYNDNMFRKIGYWKSVTGKIYHFLETAKDTKYGIKRDFSQPQSKNYSKQGMGADVQGGTSAALLALLLKHPDKIKMCNEIHDSKKFYIKTEYKDRILPKIKDIIEDVPKIFKERFNIHVPFKFKIDIKIGDNFSNMENYEI